MTCGTTTTRRDPTVVPDSETSSDLRASDAERDRAVERLTAHAGAGLLEAAELEERVAAALSARTVGELRALEADLPDPPRPRPRRARRRIPAEELRPYLAVMALLVAIWALTGGGYFWPVWPALGWGLGLVLCAGSSSPGRRHARRTRAPA